MYVCMYICMYVYSIKRFSPRSNKLNAGWKLQLPSCHLWVKFAMTRGVVGRFILLWLSVQTDYHQCRAVQNANTDYWTDIHGTCSNPLQFSQARCYRVWPVFSDKAQAKGLSQQRTVFCSDLLTLKFIPFTLLKNGLFNFIMDSHPYNDSVHWLVHLITKPTF